MKKVILVLGTILVCASCSSTRTYPTFAEDGSQGHFSLNADAAGMREFQTGLAGMIREGKAPAKADTTPYWQYRNQQEKALTLQKIDPNTQGIGKLIRDFLVGNPLPTNEVAPAIPQEQQGS